MFYMTAYIETNIFVLEDEHNFPFFNVVVCVNMVRSYCILLLLQILSKVSDSSGDVLCLGHDREPASAGF